ncbi:MAG: LPS-assembly protein LptD [Opitutus sp.]|nr:LPS-assembly protein LptD [Opitutus sp.]
MIRRLSIVVALAANPFVLGQALPSQFAVSGDETSIDLSTGESILRGHTRMSDDGLLLLADEIRYNVLTRVTVAAGNISLTLVPGKLVPGAGSSAAARPSGFTPPAARLLADRLSYQGSDGSFTADHVRFGSYPVFLEGKSAFGTRDKITIESVRGNYGEPGPWQPTFRADRIVYEGGQQLRAEYTLVGIGPVQPLRLPRFQQDLDQPFAFGVALDGGYRQSLGAYGEVDLFLPVTRGLRLGGDFSFYTSRGIMVGPAGRYDAPGDPTKLHGYFRSGYISDHGNRQTDILNRPVPRERAFIEWEHNQKISDRLTLGGQLNWWRDSEVLRDFRPRAFFPVQAPDTFAEAVYTGGNIFVSAFARFQPNPFQRVQERLPEIRLDLLPMAIGAGFYERFNASAVMLREDPLAAIIRTGGAPLAAGPRLSSDRLDAYYALMRPIASRDWLSFTPLVGGRVTNYRRTVGAVRTGNYTRFLGEAGADAELRSSGVFDYKNERWKIDGLRHLFTPRLSYRYIPEGAKGRAFIPRIDREVFTTYLPPLGLGDARNLDDLHATNTLRLALDNTLQTRDTGHGSRDLLVLNVAGDFRFQRQPGQRDVSDVHTELALLPAPWLQFDVYESFSPRSLTMREFNSGLTVREGSAWSVRVANNFLRNEIQDYLIDGRIRLNEVFEGLTRLHYDARKHRFNEQSYGIVHNLANTWQISYTISLFAGRSRESSFGFNVQVDTVRF